MQSPAAPTDSPLPPIQLADPLEAEFCPDIERAASALYAETAHAWLVGQAAPAEVYVRAAEQGNLLVARAAVDPPARRPAAFVLVRPVGPDVLYVAELAVLPALQGRRLGARLLDAAEDVARARGGRWLLLRTFRAVPWNAPYYRRLGFGDPPPGLSEEALGEMCRIAEKEASHGLSGETRLFMARAVRGR
ncbi:GNAT family N-acetyltransferase [Caenispirillum salinarum]|uniref:GNAT family N-acetyltransferase n=1 Tax=Caenispirillum salinarum TaxID=859058 RepID=UPI00384AE91A